MKGKKGGEKNHLELIFFFLIGNLRSGTTNFVVYFFFYLDFLNYLL